LSANINLEDFLQVLYDIALEMYSRSYPTMATQAKTTESFICEKTTHKNKVEDNVKGIITYTLLFHLKYSDINESLY